MNKSQNKINGLKERGMLLVRQNRPEEALDIFNAALAISRNDPDILMAMGILNGMLGRYSESEKFLQSLTGLNPKLSAAHYNLAIAQKCQGKLQQAATSYRAAISSDPNVPDYYNNLGNILLDLNEPDDAIECFNRAIALSPQSPDYYYNLGRALMARGLTDKAIDAYNTTIQLKADHVAAYKALGSARLSNGNTDEAESLYRHAMKLDPGDHEAIAGLANVYTHMRKHDEAYKLLLPLLSADSASTSVAISFAEIAPAIGKEKDAIELLENRLSSHNETSGNLRAQIHFRLGKFYDKQEDYQSAFIHYQKGNSLRSGTASSVNSFKDLVNKLIDTFTENFLGHAPKASASPLQAIFIVGMPRSGSTLVEQIISSHPDVHGAGELDTLPAIVDSIPGLVKETVLYPDAIQSLEAEHIQSLSNDYYSHIASIAPEAGYVTDKMPSNFINLGLIRLLFPDARIIHCKRNPIDTCLSCYFQDFAGHHPYTTDLAALGNYYHEYKRLMAHWDSVLDAEIYDLYYDNLVNDFEATCKNLIEYCGLEWNDACLEFYANKRKVLTASSNQVNKPLYKSSVNRWKNYEAFISPLLSVLSNTN